MEKGFKISPEEYRKLLSLPSKTITVKDGPVIESFDSTDFQKVTYDSGEYYILYLLRRKFLIKDFHKDQIRKELTEMGISLTSL
jgi:hypothetical protein